MVGATGSFPRSHRLLRPAQFQRVLKGGTCRAGTTSFNMLAVPNELDHARLGIAITKRHVRRAVVRNRIRRQIRESFRLHQEQVAGLDVVVLGRAGIGQLDGRILRSELDRTWELLAKRCKKY